MNKEPIIIINAIAAGLIAIQAFAIDMPTWLHVVIVGLIAAFGTITARSQVTPVAGGAK